MKCKLAVSSGLLPTLGQCLVGSDMIQVFFETLEILGVENAPMRPAEYYMQRPDETVDPSDRRVFGIEARLTGVSRNGRSSGAIKKAAEQLQAGIDRLVREHLPSDFAGSIQIWAVLMLDGEIEIQPGVYSNLVEPTPTWILPDGDEVASAAA